MKKDTFISTDIQTRATAKLSEEVSNELNTPDPSEEEARAALKKAMDTSCNPGCCQEEE